MPAYRSEAEAEIRDAVVARIREHRPEARIIHEINVSTYGPNRLDLIAVSRDEIIAVEIKSARDKLDRLEAQYRAMEGSAHHAIAVIHEKFLEEKQTNRHVAEYERDGAFYLRQVPAPFTYSQGIWVYPERPGVSAYGPGAWRFPKKRLEAAAPAESLGFLWRDELFRMCASLRVCVGRRATMAEMTAALRWHCTGAELTRGICAALRARRCVEADPEIVEMKEAS